MTDFETFVAGLSLGRKDFGDAIGALSKGLAGERPEDILRLHEDLVAEASLRCRNGTIPSRVMRAFDVGHPNLDDMTPTAALRRLDAFDRWHLGYHVHGALCGFPRPDPATKGGVPYVDDDPWGPDDTYILFDGNRGLYYLHKLIPVAYEEAAGGLWPRAIRMRESGQPLLEFTNPRQLGNGRAPSPLRDYWSRLEEHAAEVNDSEEWWSWLRTTDVRQFTLDCGSRDWYGARRQKSGTYSRTVRSPRPFLHRGGHLILGLAPDENAILALTVDEATARATTDFEDVFRAAADHLGVSAPPALTG